MQRRWIEVWGLNVFCSLLWKFRSLADKSKNLTATKCTWFNNVKYVDGKVLFSDDTKKKGTFWLKMCQVIVNVLLKGIILVKRFWGFNIFAILWSEKNDLLKFFCLKTKHVSLYPKNYFERFDFDSHFKVPLIFFCNNLPLNSVKASVVITMPMLWHQNQC